MSRTVFIGGLSVIQNVKESPMDLSLNCHKNEDSLQSSSVVKHEQTGEGSKRNSQDGLNEDFQEVRNDSGAEMAYDGDFEKMGSDIDLHEAKKLKEGDLSQDADITVVSIRSLGIDTLIKGLSTCNNFSCTFESLAKYLNHSIMSIKSLAEQFPRLLSVRENRLKLKAILKICKQHHSSQGCDNKYSCKELHICKEFVKGNCTDALCIFGHNWKTGHNNVILENYSCENLSQEIMQKITQTFQTIASKDFLVNICQPYNDDVCLDVECPSLHVCRLYFFSLIDCKSKCPTHCSLNHDLMNPSCIHVLSGHDIAINETPRDIALAVVAANPLLINENKRSIEKKESAENRQTIWSHFLTGDIAIKEICYNSVVSMCPMEEMGCPRLHSSFHFHWQISQDGIHWLNLRLKQVKCLELAYCKPSRDGAQLPLLDPTLLDSSLRTLFLMMGRDTWSANFSSMTLENSQVTKKLKLRRLCTEYMFNKDKSIRASNFAWYFSDACNTWVCYGDADSSGNTNLKSSISSEEIENKYKENPQGFILFSNSQFSYILDFQQMCQTNQGTGKSRQVKRRPIPHLQEEDLEKLPDDWNVVFPIELVQRVTLDENSQQYKTVIALLNQKQPFPVNWIQVERIENLHLWRTYQNKVKEMNYLYGNYNTVDVRYLFYGTSADKVSSICKENFDWRVQGTNYHQSFGYGNYFTTDSHLAAQNTTPDAFGHRYLFLALVAIGTVTVGDASMKRPPINPATNIPFDSTSNAVDNNASIIVKYDKQEYYPQFLVTYI